MVMLCVNLPHAWYWQTKQNHRVLNIFESSAWNPSFRELPMLKLTISDKKNTDYYVKCVLYLHKYSIFLWLLAVCCDSFRYGTGCTKKNHWGRKKLKQCFLSSFILPFGLSSACSKIISFCNISYAVVEMYLKAHLKRVTFSWHQFHRCSEQSIEHGLWYFLTLWTLSGLLTFDTNIGLPYRPPDKAAGLTVKAAHEEVVHISQALLSWYMWNKLYFVGGQMWICM